MVGPPIRPVARSQVRICPRRGRPGAMTPVGREVRVDSPRWPPRAARSAGRLRHPRAGASEPIASHDEPAVGRERHRAPFPARLGRSPVCQHRPDGPAGGGVPEPDAAVLAAGGGEPAVGRERDGGRRHRGDPAAGRAAGRSPCPRTGPSDRRCRSGSPGRRGGTRRHGCRPRHAPGWLGGGASALPSRPGWPASPRRARAARPAPARGPRPSRAAHQSTSPAPGQLEALIEVPCGDLGLGRMRRADSSARARPRPAPSFVGAGVASASARRHWTRHAREPREEHHHQRRQQGRTALLRRHHRTTRSHGPTRRARIGRSSRNRLQVLGQLARPSRSDAPGRAPSP